eukprot:scaffold92264_cov20-Tisochrysis_lutea.AAC.1
MDCVPCFKSATLEAIELRGATHASFCRGVKGSLPAMLTDTLCHFPFHISPIASLPHDRSLLEGSLARLLRGDLNGTLCDSDEHECAGRA